MTSLLLAMIAPAQKAAAAAGKTINVPLQQLPRQAPPPLPPPQTWMQAHAGWLTHGLSGLFVIAAIALIVLLAVQTTKQEGLSGSIGGRVESAYGGRMGAEDQLKRITGLVAGAFVVIAFILSLTGI